MLTTIGSLTENSDDGDHHTAARLDEGPAMAWDLWKNIARRDTFSGGVATGGIVTVRESAWLMSWTVNPQPHFKQQPEDQVVAWAYSLFVDTPGDFAKRPMQERMGEEITHEWLYHLGVPVDEIPERAATGAMTVPYVTSFFLPRRAGDRPDVVPDGAVNFAFIGQFAEATRLRDGEELHLPGPGLLHNQLLRRIDATEIGEPLSKFGLIHEKR